MIALRLVAIVVALIAGCAQLHAQTPAPLSPAEPEGGAKAKVGRALAAFDASIYPIINTIAPGGGLGTGIGYRAGKPDGGRWLFRAEALVTLRKYTSVDAALQYPRGWLKGELYARARDMKRLDFYGLGGDSSADGRANFRFLDRTVGATVSVRPADIDMLEFGGRLERLWPEIGPGRNEKWPSVDARFAEAAAPGLNAQPGFVLHSEFVGLMLPGGAEKPKLGADIRLTHRGYHDNGEGRFSFGRIELDAQQRVPGVRPGQRLTLHQYYSTTNVEDGHQVPFYLQQTLGGTGSVRSFHETGLGSDGTQATLRGFRNLRFRGPHLLLLQAEYRVKVRGPLEATVFAEAGNVALVRSGLSLRDLKKDVGFSLGYVKDDVTRVRIDVGGGGGEGLRVFFSVGGLLQR